MSVNKNGNLRPDGFSVALPLGPVGNASQSSSRSQSGVATASQASQSPVRFAGSRAQYPFGDGMAGWNASISATQQSAQGQSTPQQPGGLLGLMQDYMRNHYPVE